MKYVTPEMEFIEFSMSDIVCESDGSMSSDGAGGSGDFNVGTDAPDEEW